MNRRNISPASRASWQLDPLSAAAPNAQRTSAGGAAWPIRWCLLLLIFSVTFENIVGIENFTGTKFIGILLAGLALLQARVCLARPPLAFWCFFAYLAVYVLRALASGGFGPHTFSTSSTFAQCLILFWISYNVLRSGNMWKAVFVTLAVSNCLAAASVYVGFGSSDAALHSIDQRESVMGVNENLLAFQYAIGLLAAIALAAEKTTSIFWRLASIPMILLLLAKCVNTGSRGGMLSAFMGIVVYLVCAKGLGGKFKGLIVGGAVISALLYFVVHTDVAFERWTKMFEKGSQGTAGREAMYTECYHMFIERPFFGWGPTTHLRILAERLHYADGDLRDTHNDILYAVTATGLFGGVFYIMGLVLCGKQVWRGRYGPASSIPVALFLAAMMMSMSGTLHRTKPFWIVLSIACASGAVVTTARPLPRVSRPAMPRRGGA
jgi:O-antigen ligase